MKDLTLVSHRRYFGLPAVHLRNSAHRLLTRLVGLPPERLRLKPEHVKQDFAIDTVEGDRLVHAFVEQGLLRPRPAGDYAPTGRLRALANARVVEPLPRERARRLVMHAVSLVRAANAEWTRNPLEVDTLAVFGSYMTRDNLLAELAFGVVVRPREAERRVRWGRMANRQAGADELRTALTALSSFVVVQFVTDVAELPRPFSVVYRLDA